MTERLADQIKSKISQAAALYYRLDGNRATQSPAGREISQAAGLYYRLVLVVGPSGAGNTPVLRAVSGRTGVPLTNVSLELSRRMLDLTARQRTLRLPHLLQEIVRNDVEPQATVLLDNTEILFCADLEQDPLRLLQGLSRNRTVVATWNGAIADGGLRYATPGHPEHRHYRVSEFLAVSLEAGT